jgi:release factor glutamine methyltransferase
VAHALRSAGIATPRADARWLVRHALARTATDLALSGSLPLGATQVSDIRRLAQRRAAREPLQLVLGGTEFRGHRLALRAGVFVPRPETELLVEHALEQLPAGGTVVEPCTGSGAVACAIGVERPGTRIVATDRDPGAVALATHNAAALGAIVDVRLGDLLEPVPIELRGAVDVLVANPPYLRADELGDVPAEVARWDPVDALVAGPTGHEASDRLLGAAPRWLAPGGSLLLELDERRVEEAGTRACAAGLTEVETRFDLADRPRFLVARRPR